jgi:hypothetical protein
VPGKLERRVATAQLAGAEGSQPSSHRATSKWIPLPAVNAHCRRDQFTRATHVAPRDLSSPSATAYQRMWQTDAATHEPAQRNGAKGIASCELKLRRDQPTAGDRHECRQISTPAHADHSNAEASSTRTTRR